MDIAKPATILLRKDWLFPWIGAVLSVFGAQIKARDPALPAY
jgi:hypothetical protein